MNASNLHQGTDAMPSCVSAAARPTIPDALKLSTVVAQASTAKATPFLTPPPCLTFPRHNATQARLAPLPHPSARLPENVQLAPQVPSVLLSQIHRARRAPQPARASSASTI